MILFDLKAYELHHKRTEKTFCDYSFLFDHVGSEVLERLRGMKRGFDKVLDFSPYPLPYESLHHRSLSKNFPFSKNSYDLALSCLLLHWVNNLPEFLANVRCCLRAEGVFLGALWGGNTLYELRESLLQAEVALKGGASPRIAPMLRPSDAPLLLSRSGFSNSVVDKETLVITYKSLWALMKDLRGMGENNKLQDRVKTFTSRALFEKAEEIYRTSFGQSDGKLPATVEIIYLTGRTR